MLDHSCSPGLGFLLSIDQRGIGFNRKVGTHVDLSAFEASYTIAVNSGNNQSVGVAAAFATLQVLVKESDNPVSGISATFTTPVTGASSTFANNPATGTGNASDLASAPTFTANSTTGSHNVTATLTGSTKSTTFSLQNLPDPATRFAVPAPCKRCSSFRSSRRPAIDHAT